MNKACLESLWYSQIWKSKSKSSLFIILLMEEILYHLGCIKLCQTWVFFSNELVWFLPSTVWPIYTFKIPNQISMSFYETFGHYERKEAPKITPTKKTTIIIYISNQINMQGSFWQDFFHNSPPQQILIIGGGLLLETFETNIAPENGWLEDDPFDGWKTILSFGVSAYFQVLLLMVQRSSTTWDR